MTNKTVQWAAEMDGDGTVYIIEIITRPILPGPRLRLTFNSGGHLTQVEMDLGDAGLFSSTLTRALKEGTKQ